MLIADEADEAENNLYHNSTHSLFKIIRTLASRWHSVSTHPVIKLDGSTCFSAGEVLSLWRKHFSTILNFLLGTPSSIRRTQFWYTCASTRFLDSCG